MLILNFLVIMAIVIIMDWMFKKMENKCGNKTAIIIQVVLLIIVIMITIGMLLMGIYDGSWHTIYGILTNIPIYIGSCIMCNLFILWSNKQRAKKIKN